MMKSKKLLSALLTFLMVFSLVVIPQSAFAAATAEINYSLDSVPPASEGKHGNSPTIVGGVYGRSGNVGQLYATSSAKDFYLGVFANNNFELSAGMDVVFSYDVAFDVFSTSGFSSIAANNHCSTFAFNNESGSQILNLELIQVNDNGKVYSLNTDTGINFATGTWHNVTAVLSINEAGTGWSCDSYIDGVSVANKTGTVGTAFKYVRNLRIADRSYDIGNVYIDNVHGATYPSTDNVSVSFSDASTKTDASLVDTTNKKITLSANNIAMTVEAFNAIDDGFVFLKNDGTTAESTDKIADCNAYAVMANDTNSYYVPYTVEYPTPVIVGTSDRTKAIIDNDEKTISLVDNQYLTVGEFKAETTGAKVMNGDDEAADDALLSGCTVYATIDGYAELDQEYTLVYSREYLILNETFSNTVSNPTSNNGTAYTITTNAGNMAIKSYRKDTSTTNVVGASGLGGKAEDDTSLAMIRSGYTFVSGDGKADPFLITGVPAMSGNFTLEFKILLSKDENDTVTNFDLYTNGKQVMIFGGNGSINVINPKTLQSNSTLAETYKFNEWIPVAFTYYAHLNTYDMYVNGRVVSEQVPTTAAFSDIRFRTFFASGSNGDSTYAIDDLKLYTGGLEEYKLAYYKDGVETTDIASANTVKVVASDSFNYVPVLAKYQAGELVAISVGTNKTAEMTIGDASEVKFFYWNSVAGATPFEKSKTVYASDGVNPVTAYNATLSNAFGNGMVLQRGEEIKVWGTANDANYSALTVALGDEKKTAYVMDGEWEVSFDARSANSDGIDLTVTTLSSTTQVNDILIGDVYVVAGQSNAALPLSVTSEYLKHQNNEMRSFDGNVRMLYQPRNSDACTTPRKTLIDDCEWGIVEFQKGSAYAATVLPRYSALGIYFGEYLADGLKAANIDVPIGIIEATLGGTSLFEHVNEEIFNKYNPTYLATANKASRIYNKNIAPFEKFAVNGVIWYQGENESIGSIIDESTKIYADMFADYLGQYRQTDDFNAFVVQLSSHTTNAHSDGTAGWNVPRMRAYQYDMAKNDGYYIIPSLDHGVKTEEYDAATDKSDIAAHPKYKKPIGERAANAVLAVIYGQDAAMAPVYDTITYAEDKVTITFKNAGSGLSLANGESLLGFELIKDGVATAATATITGTNTVELTGVTGATGVRYAFYRSAPKTIANLANSYGVACPTFVHSNDGNDIGKINPISLGAME